MIDDRTVPVSDTFGNYALKGMAETLMPAEPGLLPLAPGWYVVGGLALVVLGIWGLRAATRWHRDRYRRDAVKLLESLVKADVGRVATILKRVALVSYDRPVVANLTGNRWLEFLSGHYDGPSMHDETGKLIISTAYEQPGHLGDLQFNALKERVALWILTHRVEGAS